MKKIFFIVLNSFLPSFLLFVGKNDYLIQSFINWNILPKTVVKEEIQVWFFLGGILWTGIILPFQFAILNHTYQKQQAVFESLLGQYRNVQLKRISLILGNIELKVRIFVPQKGIIGYFKKHILNETILKLIHINGISDVFHSKSISFKVNHHKPEGVVGKAYKEKTSIIDYDLNTTNTYSITPEQRLIVDAVQFCAAIPVLNNKNNSIAAVVSFDSDQKVSLTESQVQDLHNNMIYFAAFIEKHINFKKITNEKIN